jgi:hypothetical protein
LVFIPPRVLRWSASKLVTVEHVNPTRASTLVLYDKEVTAEAVTLHHVSDGTHEWVDDGGTDYVSHLEVLSV